MDRDDIYGGADGGIELSEDDERKFHQFVLDGRHREALAWLEPLGDFRSRTDRRGRTVAARLLNIFGNDRGSSRVHLVNFRAYPDDPTAVFFGALEVGRRFGPLRSIDLVQGFLDSTGDRAREEESFAALWAHLGADYAAFRDFSLAHECLDRALELDPTDTWLLIMKSHVLLGEDRNEESIEVAEQALERTPNYWPAIRSVADHYWRLHRDEETYELARRAVRTNESAAPAQRLAQFLDEDERREEALDVLEEYERRCLFADKSTRKWIASFRASLLYQSGRGTEMLPFAKEADYPFCNRIAKRVEEGLFENGRRVRLPVAFVRQNQLTCSPATLTALSRYFGRPAEHLAVAEEICYDGTPDYKERLWAEQEGWTVREFRADWEVTRQLIDAGVPFALATVEPTSAHLQAVIGYDSRAQTIIIRDPGERHYSEAAAEPFFEEYAHCGPRALLFVPPEMEEAICAIELPDEKEYSLLNELNCALERHARGEARQFLDRMESLCPGRRLVDQARYLMSCYDCDPKEGMRAAENMAKRFPDSVRWEYALYTRRYAEMSREERIAFLRQKVAQEQVFTLYFKELAELLALDARDLEEARYQFRRAIRYRRMDAEVYHGLAGALWTQREYRRATFLYRLASCLADKNESYADSYFKASRLIGNTDEALAMLRDRFERFARSSSGPTITYCNALRLLDRETEVGETLETALGIPKVHGDLVSYAASYFASVRNNDLARELAERARGEVSESSRCRLLAQLAELDSKPEEALKQWRAVLERDPLSVGAHRAVARLLEQTTDSDDASVNHLRSACEEFPYLVPLHEMTISWLRERGPGHAEEALRTLTTRHPSNTWAWRELALELSEQQRFEEALEAAKLAVEVEPGSSWSQSVLGLVYESLHLPGNANECFRAALDMDVENESAMRGLVRVAESGAGRREALLFIERQMTEQVLQGEAFHSFREIAYSVLEPAELLEALQRAHAARPDLWETWSVLVEQYLAMEKVDEAASVAAEEAERFPLVPRSWLDRARVFASSGDTVQEVAMLRQALQLNPQWTNAKRQLSEALERSGELEEAVSLLERAVREEPAVSVNHGCLADLLWKAQRTEEAFATVVRSVRNDPEYDWGWTALGEWARLLDKKEEAIAEGERLTREVPLRTSSWRQLARLFHEFGEFEKAIETLEKGIGHIPFSIELIDLKATLLCEAGRFHAALHECRSERWEGKRIPKELLAREACIEYDRGNSEAAIEKMTVVVQDHPDYFQAHDMLYEWHLAAKNWEKAEAMVRHLVRLRPGEPMPYGKLAELLLAQERKREAREAFNRAFRLSPSYGYAGYHLVLLNLESNQLDEAEEVQKLFEYHHPMEAGTYELKCRVAMARKNVDLARQSFRDLCLTPNAGTILLERVEAGLQGRISMRELERLYFEALSGGEVRSPGIARRWVLLRLAEKGANRVAEELDGLPLPQEVSDGAWQELIYELENREQLSAAVSLLRRYAKRYRDSTVLWASAGYVLRQAGRYREVLTWMGDWKEREGVLPWMLISYSFANARTGGVAQAGPVHVHAVEELPEDHDTCSHCACAAYFEASRGNPGRARMFLEHARSGRMNLFYQAIASLAELQIEWIETGRIDGSLFREAIMVNPGWEKLVDFRVYFWDTAKLWRAFLRTSGARGPFIGALLTAATSDAK